MCLCTVPARGLKDYIKSSSQAKLSDAIALLEKKVLSPFTKNPRLVLATVACLISQAIPLMFTLPGMTPDLDLRYFSFSPVIQTYSAISPECLTMAPVEFESLRYSRDREWSATLGHTVGEHRQVCPRHEYGEGYRGVTCCAVMS